MINKNLLLSRMKLKNVSTKALADVQKWSITTAYRKINGDSNCTAPEIQVCVDLLDLDTETANAIFFASKMS